MKNLRIEDKLLVSAESSHVLEYQYDEGGRLRLVKYNGENVEIYRYNQLGQRVFSHVANSDKQEYRYNDLGQLVRAGDTTYTYDEDGDLSEKNSPEGMTRYEYLKTGQLCEVHLRMEPTSNTVSINEVSELPNTSTVSWSSATSGRI